MRAASSFCDTNWPGLTALHTPGHTPGHHSFRFRDVLFVGDTATADATGLKPMGSFIMSDPMQGLADLARLGAVHFSGTAMQLLDDALPIYPLIVITARILIIHAKPHRVIEQNRNLTCCCSHCFRFADACSQPPVECT